jgi:hypothetical protein
MVVALVLGSLDRQHARDGPVECQGIKDVSAKKQVALVMLTICVCVAAFGRSPDFCSRVSEIPPSECAALVAFYNATDGPHWKDQRGWLESPSPCTWFGVRCSAGHVTCIAINYNELRGNLPAELEDLPQLETLSLYYNRLSGAIPAEIGRLSNLQELILHNNQLSGGIPPELGGLLRLRKLDLDGNELTGTIPAELGELVELRDLMLRDNQLSGGIPPELGNLSKLEGLFLSSNDLRGSIPHQLGQLKNLRMFSVYGNDLSGPVPSDLVETPSSGYELLWADDDP